MRPFILLLTACLLAASEPTVPVPLAVPEGAFAVVIVPDLRATLGRIELAAQALTPDSLPPGKLAEQLGTMLGDPNLANLGAGAVLIAIGPGGAVPSAAMIVPSNDPAGYVAAAQRLGHQAEAAGQLVVVGKKPADLALGKRIAQQHAALTAAPLRGDLRVLVAPQRIVTAYQPILAGFSTMVAGQMAKEPNGAVAAKIVGLEIAGFLAAIEDVAGCQCDLSLDGTTLTMDSTVQAKADGLLAKALVQPPVAAGPRLAKRMGLDPGYFVMIGSYHAPGACAWLAGLLETLRKQPAGKDIIDDATVALVREWGEAADGGFAMRLRAVGDQLMRIDGANGARDGVRLQALQKRITDIMFVNGPIADLYRQMGIGMTYTENVRASGSIPVARVAYTIDESKLPADQLTQMRQLMQDFELAALPDANLFANDPATLDLLVAGAGPALPTAAEHAVGPGRDGYVDLDWLGLAKMAMRANSAQVPGMAEAFAKLPSGAPLTGAWTARDGRLLWEGRIPLKPFFDFGKAMQAGIRQQMEPNGEDVPPAPPENAEQMF